MSTEIRDDALAGLAYIASLGADLPNARWKAIQRAEQAGCSRREIASALGISVQALGRFIERRDDVR